MIDTVQSVAVVVANAAMPGSGAIVGATFEVLKFCADIAAVLSGMEETAASIKTQQQDILDTTADLTDTLKLLQLIHEKPDLIAHRKIVRFEVAVREYDRVVTKFAGLTLLKQLLFRGKVEDVRKNVMTAKNVLESALKTELTVRIHGRDTPSPRTTAENRATRSLSELEAEREKRYLQFFNSPEVLEEMKDPDNQREMLAIIAHQDRLKDVSGRTGNKYRDPIVGAMKEKLWGMSTRSVHEEVSNLPSWYITEDLIDTDTKVATGFGGDADVYRGTLRGDTPVAVKVLKDAVAGSAPAKQRFVATVDIWYRLVAQGKFICRLYGACHLTAKPFFVMELCDSGSMDSFLRENASHREEVAIQLLVQAAQGIASMHSLAIVHGDLKSDNILVTTSSGSPQARVSDFDRSFDWGALKRRRLTNGMAENAGIEISAALNFLAPECVDGFLPSPMSDVYSFGMTIYQALAGCLPYADISTMEELRVCKQNGELPARDGYDISDRAWALIAQCCHQQPQQRPPMDEVAKALQTLARSQRNTESSYESHVEDQAQTIEADLNATLGVDSSSVQVSVENASLQPVVVTPPAVEGHRAGADEASTPVKGPRKVRVLSRAHKIAIALVLVLVAAGVASVVVMTWPPSATTANLGAAGGTSSPTTTTEAPTPSPGETTTTPTLTVPTTTAPATTAPTPIPTPTTTDPATAAPTPTTTEPATPTPTPTTTEPATTTPIPTTTEPATPEPTPTTTEPATTTPAPTTTAPATTTPAPLVAQVSTIMGYGSSYSTTFSYLEGVAIASDSYIYLSDENRILRMLDGGSTSVFSGALSDGDTDGARAFARFAAPRAMAFSSSDDLYICDYGNYVVRKLTGGTTVSTYSSFSATDMRGIVVDSAGNVYVTGGGSNKVTKITAAETVTTFWSGGTVVMGITVDSSDTLYVSDMYAVRKITPAGTATLLAGSTTTSGYVNGVGTAARFKTPRALTIGSDGNLYVADSGNNCIRKLDLVTLEVTAYAGLCGSFGSADGDATTAQFDNPRAIAAASSSVFYIVDGGNSQERVRKLYLG